MLRPQTVLSNRYSLIRMLGKGGMGTVWLAHDKRNNKNVAIKIPKIFNDPRRDKLCIEKLKLEGRILQRLNHKYIPRFIDLFYYGQLPILVIEYIDGVLLEKKSAGYGLQEEEAKKIMEKILDTVSYIHSLNIIHRDIRPKNIILKHGKTPYLMDFGTAKYFFDQLSEAVVAPGGYTAPEQYDFISSPQSDIWSLGATLFYMVTGQHPIILMPGYPKHIREPDPRRLNKDISEEIAQVIMKSMKKNPSERFSSAQEMLLALKGKEFLIYAPHIVIGNVIIKLDYPRIIIGRYNPNCKIDTRIYKQRVYTWKEGDVKRVAVVDPQCYIGRRHAEIYEAGGKWYIRDLGSLNKTAIIRERKSRIIVVWKARKQISPSVQLKDRDIIALAYDEKLGPYFTFTFKEGSS